MGGPGSGERPGIHRLLTEAYHRIDQHLPEIFEMLCVKAKEGNVDAAREILDRRFGKAKQALEIEGTLSVDQVITLVNRALSHVKEEPFLLEEPYASRE